MNGENDVLNPTIVEPSTTDDAAKLEKKCPALVVIDQKLIDLSNVEMEIKMEVG